MLTCTTGFGDMAPYDLPLAVGRFEQQVHRAYTPEQGLPSDEIQSVGLNAQGSVVALTEHGAAVFDDGLWKPCNASEPLFPAGVVLTKAQASRLKRLAGPCAVIRAVAEHEGELAAATDQGLFTGTGRQWRLALPSNGVVRWAPVDVRAVAYDSAGLLWFASSQGVGCRLADHSWRLYTGKEGLPFNDFTCMAAGPKGVWFGTTNGAIHFYRDSWAFRQGRRWLLDNHVRDIVVDGEGAAWIATAKGVSCLAFSPTTLAEKAAFYEDEIEKYHRRTVFGFVDPANLALPGDKSTATPVFTDNDGHFTGLYLGAVALGYQVTKDPRMKADAARAFRALSFLSEVTEGGTHPAPRGFIARAVLPTSEPDPNPDFDLAYDLKRRERDALWKIIQPRWPVDASGQWYWKNDSSSDELDGHFFGYAAYFDHACETEAERDAVRVVVARIMDHILDHGYNLVDHDGAPTRWGRFSPDDLNRNEAWCEERGLNSYSILTYLSIAHHITGNARYRDAYLALALDHGYGMNGMTQPKCLSGPGAIGHQPDDNMAFMNYYHLVRYETDPKLLGMYHHAIHTHWQHEKRERNSFENFVYAACCQGKVRTDHWGVWDISPSRECLEEGIDTLKRYPMDLIDWSFSNEHRTDMIPLPDAEGNPSGKGGRHDGEVFPIDERSAAYWDEDPWALSHAGTGMRLRDGVSYLLAYYLGRAHGIIGD